MTDVFFAYVQNNPTFSYAINHTMCGAIESLRDMICECLDVDRDEVDDLTLAEIEDYYYQESEGQTCFIGETTIRP
ncbi:hypothetical protein [uncultured Methylobacterium sp.]|jgi:hypothetical protein|uniref:hypothetical protein n=1 Tax=uncultured Methylobacterium sp. TaxID=157278 RepID=UPI0026334D92|nr:hypothetical protein [uncultured Methylobacterium sp.]